MLSHVLLVVLSVLGKSAFDSLEDRITCSLISTVGSIWIRDSLLCVVGGVRIGTRSTSSTRSRLNWASSICSRRVRVAVAITSSSSIVAPAAIRAVPVRRTISIASLASITSTVATLRSGPILEFLVLLGDILQKVNAELFGFLDFVRIRATFLESAASHDNLGELTQHANTLFRRSLDWC